MGAEREAGRGAAESGHQPVMVPEILALLQVASDGVYIDGTVGAGGHAAAIAERLGAGGRLIGLDRDAEALAYARPRLARFAACRLVPGNFANLKEVAAAAGYSQVDGILLDLGMSSMQVDAADRGFSFQEDAPLDMRMDCCQSLTAADLIRQAGAEQLADIIYTLGEEPWARRIARAMVRERARQQVLTTGWLAGLVARVKGSPRGRRHPATQTFQALRLAVNAELECLERGLESGLALLKVGGRMAVLAYHSLEDRRIKEIGRAHVGRWESQPAGGRRWVGRLPVVRWVTPKVLRPSPEEVLRNPRARSAKLRVIERVG